MKVLKFGGSSLASVERFLEVAGIVKQQVSAEPIGLVLSAPQGVTNLLVELTDLAYLGADYSLLLQQWVDRLAQLQLQADSCLAGADQQRLTEVRQQQYQQLTNQLSGVALLRYCPDHIKAQILGVGRTIQCRC